MTRPTILDLDLVVVPREATVDMRVEANSYEDLGPGDTFTIMLSASPYHTAWDDVRKYVEGLEADVKREANLATTYASDCMDEQKRAEAAEARIAELEAALDEKEVASGLTENGNLWRFWSTKASTLAVRNAELEKRLAKADVVVELAEEYIIDGITTAKVQYEINAPYPAREPGYRAALDDARAAHAAARAYMEGK